MPVRLHSVALPVPDAIAEVSSISPATRDKFKEWRARADAQKVIMGELDIDEDFE